jgi:putative transposase
VWCPKFRRPVLDEEVAGRLSEILHEVADDLQCTIEELDIMPDHVHVLIDCDPSFGIYNIVKRMKGRSSRLISSEFPRIKSRLPTLWTNSVCVLTTGGATIEIIRKYIQNQKGK